SLPLSGDEDNPRAWYLGTPNIEPVRAENWVGKVSRGARVNFNRIEFSPHAHGTHTESYGHISREFYSVSRCLDRFFFKAKLISITPEAKEKDQVISRRSVKQKINPDEAEALIIRTLPNDRQKPAKNYDHSNWPYLETEAATYIRKCGIKHLLIDLPSIDREKGDVTAHRAFWDYPDNPRKKASITEFIFVPDELEDGDYLLNLQVAHFINDAAPSRPILYRIEENFSQSSPIQ